MMFHLRIKPLKQMVLPLLFSVSYFWGCAEGGADKAALSASDASAADSRVTDVSADSSKDTQNEPLRCTQPSDCNDGLVCNGVETCMDGQCLRGMAPDCTDTVACTVDRCSEPTASGQDICIHQPDDARCSSGQSCTMTGCSRNVVLRSEGEICTDTSTCQSGLECIDVLPDLIRIQKACVRRCATHNTCSSRPGSACTTDAQNVGIQYCSLSCDPLTQSGCPGGLACVVTRTGTTPDVPFTTCRYPGTTEPGGTCTGLDSCTAGHFCVGGTCKTYCDVNNNTGCFPFLEYCSSLSPRTTLGTSEVGFCRGLFD